MAQLSALVGALAHDDAALRDLRHDPPALGRSQHLTPEDVAALSSADRFFTTEAPILDQPRQAAPALPRPQVADEVFRAAQPAVSGITASPDTGTLLPGPTSGTYTITSTATATATSTSTPVPGQPAPGPRPPAQPVAPGPPPSAPVVPGIPQPSAPGPVPPAPISAPAELAVPDGGHCGCEAAIVAIVAEVSATANAAITAITAIARQRARAGHVTTKTQ